MVAESAVERAFVFVDLVGHTDELDSMDGNKTQKLRRFHDTVLTPFHKLIHGQLPGFRGHQLWTEGDAYLLEFSQASRAVQWSLALTEDLARHPIHMPSGHLLRLRVTIDWGPAIPNQQVPGQYVAQDISRAKRMQELAQPGDVLVTRVVKTLAENDEVSGVGYESLGVRTLKGVGQVEVWRVTHREQQIDADGVALPARQTVPAGSSSGFPQATTEGSGFLPPVVPPPETPKPKPPQPRPSRAHQPACPPWQRRWVQAVAGSLLALVFAVVAWQLWPPTPDTDPTYDELATLPGLNGLWWAEETPWLTPVVRAGLVDALAGRDGQESELLRSQLRASDPTTAYAALWQQFRSLALPTPAARELHDALSPSIYNPRELTRHLGQYAESLAAAGAAAEWHTLAALQLASGDARLLDQAASSFEQALRLYALESPRPGRAGLRRLCHLDFARLLIQKQQWPQAMSQLNHASQSASGRPAPPLARYAALLGMAQVHSAMRDWQLVESRLESAQQLVASTFPQVHPLRPWTVEKLAWYHMDRWSVTRSGQEFSAGSDDRRELQRLLSSTKSDESDVLKMALLTTLRNDLELLHNEHGLAMVKRYSGHAGDCQSAYAQLNEALSQLEQTGPHRGLAQGKRLVCERLTNTLERLGDAYFYAPGDAARQRQQRLQAAEFWRSAANYAAQADDAQTWIVLRARLLAKRALAAALSQPLDEARLEWAQVNTYLQSLSPDERAQFARPLERNLAYHTAAELLLNLQAAADDTAAPRAELRRFARWLAAGKPGGSFTAAATAPAERLSGELQRDDRELALLTFAELLASNQRAEDRQALADDLQAMAQLIPAEADDDAVLCFLRPQFDVLIEHTLGQPHSDAPAQAAELMRWAKSGKRRLVRESGPRPQVIVYLRENQGWALQLPAQGTPPRPQLLPVGWRQFQSSQPAEARSARNLLWASLADHVLGEPARLSKPVLIQWTDRGLATPLNKADFPQFPPSYVTKVQVD